MLRLDWNILFNIINILILYFLLKRFLFKPVNGILEKRQQEADSIFAQANEKEIETLTDKVDTLQEQQNELLSALETSYVNRMQNQAAVMQMQQAMTKQQTLQTAMYPMQTQRTQQPQIPIMYIKMEPIQEKPRDTAGPFRWR